MSRASIRICVMMSYMVLMTKKRVDSSFYIRSDTKYADVFALLPSASVTVILK